MWIRNFFSRFSDSYLLYFVGISTSIFLLYVLISTKVRFMHLTSYNLLSISAMSILIGYEFVLLIYFFSNVKKPFEQIIPLFGENSFISFQGKLEIELENKGALSLVILLVVIPFILIEAIRLCLWKCVNGEIPLYFSLFDPSNQWALLLDTINHLLIYLMYTMLAIIVWLIFAYTKTVNSLRKNPDVKIDIFHIDGLCGLRPIQSFALFMIVNYFLIIFLASIFSISSRELVPYETIFLLILLLLGVLFFFVTMGTIKTLVDYECNVELKKIVGRYREYYTKVSDYTSKEENNLEEKKLEKLYLVLSLLEKKENKIRNIHYASSSKRAIVTFIGSFLIPAITLLENLRSLGIF